MKTRLRLMIATALLTCAARSMAVTHYVDVNGRNPIPPYTNWATAAKVIQDAVDTAAAGDEVVVTNGVYVIGARAVYGTMTNRVVVPKALMLHSVNGPQTTFIQGYQVPGATNGDGAIRCVYLTNGATLWGFTMSNGATRLFQGDDQLERSGGGIWCESPLVLVSNCIVIGNAASFAGGGVWSGTLYDCAIVGNSVSSAPLGNDGLGGGAAGTALFNCTVATNSAYFGGGGTYNSALNNCTIGGNSTISTLFGYGGGAFGGALTNCTILANTGFDGGGVYGSTITGCDLSKNTSMGVGGGAGVSTLFNSTVTGNRAYTGGGVGPDRGGNPSIVYNCLLISNTASWAGGGAANSLLNNCTLHANLATGTAFGGGYGGGTSGGTLNNCTIVGNSAAYAGGASGGALNNCTIYYNSASNAANFTYDALLSYCCATPLPTNGIANFTNEPVVMDLVGGNLRLQPSSPCINAGNNANAPSGPDLDGNARIAGGTVDIGAYEFQNPASLISYAWLQQYGLTTDGSADFADPDGDGANNWQEWQCGTNPTNSLSALRMISAVPTGTDVTVSWQSVAGITYFLERSTNLLGPAPVFTPVAAGIPGVDGTTSYFDTNAVKTGPRFYRVGVGN